MLKLTDNDIDAIKSMFDKLLEIEFTNKPAFHLSNNSIIIYGNPEAIKEGFHEGIMRVLPEGLRPVMDGILGDSKKKVISFTNDKSPYTKSKVETDIEVLEYRLRESYLNNCELLKIINLYRKQFKILQEVNHLDVYDDDTYASDYIEEHLPLFLKMIDRYMENITLDQKK